MGIAQVLSQVTAIGSVMLLARLLSPEAFGAVAIASAVIVFFQRTLGDTGTTVALVQRNELTRVLASTTFLVNLAVGVVSSLIIFTISTPLSEFLLGPDEASDSANALRILSIMPMFIALGTVPRALLRRRMQFRSLAGALLVNAGVTAGASVVLALTLEDYRALVIGNVIGSLAMTVWLLAAARWMPRPRFSWGQFRGISGMSRDITIFNFFSYFSAYGDRLVVARIGLTELGYYGMANRLMRYPMQAVAQVNRDVVTPALVKVRDDDQRLAQVYLRNVAAVAAAILPIAVLVAAVAEPLVAVVLGEQWRPAASVVAVVALASGIQSVSATTGQVFVLKERTKLHIWWAVVAAVITTFAYWVGAHWNALGVAIGYLIAMVVLAPAAFAVVFQLLQSPTRGLVGALGPPAAASALGGAAAVVVRLGCEAVHLSDLVVCVASLTVGLGAYIAATRRWNQQGWKEMALLLPIGRGKGQPTS